MFDSSLTLHFDSDLLPFVNSFKILKISRKITDTVFNTIIGFSTINLMNNLVTLSFIVIPVYRSGRLSR